MQSKPSDILKTATAYRLTISVLVLETRCGSPVILADSSPVQLEVESDEAPSPPVLATRAAIGDHYTGILVWLNEVASGQR